MEKDTSEAAREVRFSPFDPGHLDQLVNLMCVTWYDDCHDHERSRALAADEALGYLEICTFSCEATLDGRLIGLVLARHGSCDPASAARWRELRARYLSPADTLPEGEDPAGESVYAEESRALSSMLHELGMAEDDQTLLLVVSPEARGLGLGRRLIGAAADYLRGVGASSLHLVTDTTCDWSFYEHLGLERMGTRAGSGGPQHPDEYYLYGLRLS